MATTTPPPGYPKGATQGPNGQWYLGGALLLDQGSGKPPIISPTNNPNGMPDSTQAGWTAPAGYVPYGTGSSDPNVAHPGTLTNPLGPNTQAAPQNYNDLFSRLVPVAIGTGAALMTGGAAGALMGPAMAGTMAGGAISGAAAGAAGTAVNEGASGQKVSLGSVGKGALIGGVTGGLANSGAVTNATGSLTNAGIPAPLATGIVKGGIGAGVGALGSAISGGNVGNGALTSGVSGAVGGATGAATGNPYLGQGAGIIAGNLAGKYLTSPTPVKAPVMPAAAPPIATPAKATTTQGMPTLPAAQPQPSYTPPTNVGTYSGYNGSTTGLGYAPRQEANMSGTDWATYGQGPEQQFFQPAGTQQASPPPMMQVNQGTITRANST